MSKTVRIILSVICGLLILAAPFLISSPSLLTEAYDRMTEDREDEDSIELDFGRLFFSGAMAEDAENLEELEEEVVEGLDSDLINEAYALPLDFSVPPAPKAENYTENGYEDASIRVRVEEREADGVIWHLAFVQVASPTQLRTATAHGLKSKSPASVGGMARSNNAIVAINGDNFQTETQKKTFEYRMTEKVRSSTNKEKDILIIDENGDFNLVMAAPKKEQAEALTAVAAEHQIVNAFTFGPALVRDGAELEISTHYGFNPNRPEPRAAIGQLGRLSYVMAIAEGRGESAGINFQNLAHFMKELGCTQAYNLDGGNSALLAFGDREFKGQPGGDTRAVNDIIFFATAVSEE